MNAASSSGPGSTGPVSGEDSPTAFGGGPLSPPEPPVEPGSTDDSSASVEQAEDAPLAEADPVEVLTAERDVFKDLAQRTQAEFENYRRRVASTQADEIDRATGRIVESLLPVLDACEAAFALGVEGVEPIWSSLIGVLQKHGLEALDLQGAEFDPTVAEAVVHEPADDETSSPIVSEVLRTGYRWKGRVLRAAMVKVKG